MQKKVLKTLAVVSGASLLGWLLTRLKVWEIEAVKKHPAPNSFSPAEATAATEAEPAAAGNGLDMKRIGKASEKDKDDLKLIKGIGPAIEDKLNSFGIFTYTQIANMTKEDEEALTEVTEYFPGRIERDEWVAQAKSLQQKKTSGK